MHVPGIEADIESTDAGRWSNSHNRTRYTTLRRILAARDFFRANPEGRLSTGIWSDPTWTREEFTRWLRKCLHAKINRNDTRHGRKHSEDWQRNVKKDARIINDAAKRIRRSGRNILDTPELKRRFPHVDNWIAWTLVAVMGFGLMGCRADFPPTKAPADLVTVAQFPDGSFSVDVYGASGELETTAHLPADAKVSDIFPETGEED